MKKNETPAVEYECRKGFLLINSEATYGSTILQAHGAIYEQLVSVCLKIDRGIYGFPL